MASQDASSTNGLARVVTIAETPAYLVPDLSAVYANGGSQGAPGAVELVADGMAVGVVGHLADEELIRISASILSAAR